MPGTGWSIRTARLSFSWQHAQRRAGGGRDRAFFRRHGLLTSTGADRANLSRLGVELATAISNS